MAPLCGSHKKRSREYENMPIGGMECGMPPRGVRDQGDRIAVYIRGAAHRSRRRPYGLVNVVLSHSLWSRSCICFCGREPLDQLRSVGGQLAKGRRIAKGEGEEVSKAAARRELRVWCGKADSRRQS